MGFQEDLEIGKAYEEEVIELFSILLGKKFRKVTKEKDPELYKYLDIIEEPVVKPKQRKPGFTSLITVECKWNSDNHKSSPNVVVEYTTYDDEPSGICSSLATYWVFRSGDFHLIVKRDELLKAIIYDLSHKDSHKQIKIRTYETRRLLLVPISLLLDQNVCPSTMKHLTREAFLKTAESKKEAGKVDTKV